MLSSKSSILDEDPTISGSTHSAELTTWYRSLQEKATSRIWIAEEDSVPVGYLLAIFHEAPENPFARARRWCEIDQVAAEHVGSLTRFRSLELTCDVNRQSGNCDSGYSCAFQYNISWQSATTPMTPENNPRLVFERLFSGPVKEEADANRAKREAYEKSVLDFVLDENILATAGRTKLR